MTSSAPEKITIQPTVKIDHFIIGDTEHPVRKGFTESFNLKKGYELSDHFLVYDSSDTSESRQLAVSHTTILSGCNEVYKCNVRTGAADFPIADQNGNESKISVIGFFIKKGSEKSNINEVINLGNQTIAAVGSNNFIPEIS